MTTEELDVLVNRIYEYTVKLASDMDTVSRYIKRKMYIAQIQKYIHTYISIIKEKRREVSMDIKQIKENKIRMILQFSIPSIIAMLLQTVITITDGYFTGNYVGQNALAAINLGLPILYFYLGTGLCIGVGGSVISGRMLGANERKKSSEVFSQTVVAALITCVATSVMVFLLFTSILKILRADGDLSIYFTEYYRIMLFTYPLMVVGTIFGMFIRVDGKPQICMLVSIAGCILNGVLDFFFVDIMRFGIQGSAVASLMVQILTVLAQMFYFISRKTGIGFRKFSFDRGINREMILNGSSEFIGEMASAISMFMFNYVLMKYVGAKGVAAFTILGFVVYGYSMICIGFGQGISPLVSRCWGAKEKETAFALRKITNKMLLVIGLIIAIAFFVAGKQYAGLFGCNNEVADMVATGFKIYAVTFLAMGYNVVNSMYFTSCGDAESSAIISTLRGIVFLLGFALVLPTILGMTGVWLSAPCSETLTAIIAVFLIRKQTAKRKCGELNG